VRKTSVYQLSLGIIEFVAKLQEGAEETKYPTEETKYPTDRRHPEDLCRNIQHCLRSWHLPGLWEVVPCTKITCLCSMLRRWPWLGTQQELEMLRGSAASELAEDWNKDWNLERKTAGDAVTITGRKRPRSAISLASPTVAASQPATPTVVDKPASQPQQRSRARSTRRKQSRPTGSSRRQTNTRRTRSLGRRKRQ